MDYELNSVNIGNMCKMEPQCKGFINQKDIILCVTTMQIRTKKDRNNKPYPKS